MRLREIPPKRTFVLEMDERDALALARGITSHPVPLTAEQNAILDDLLEQIQALNPTP